MYKIDCRQRNRPYPLGVTTTEFGYTYFSVVIKSGNDCGIVLYDRRTGKETRIPFSGQNKYGSIYSFAVKDLDIRRYSYNFYEGGRVFTDPYVKVLCGHEKWGECEGLLKGGFLQPDYDWQGDRPLKTPYEDSILYCLNVRGFTKHKSSKVAHKGTFRGLTEKIPYLKELGITAVELMPAYEFDELEREKGRLVPGAAHPPLTMEEAKSRFMEKPMETGNMDRPGITDNPGKIENTDNPEKTENMGKPGKNENADKPCQTENPIKTESTDKPGNPEETQAPGSLKNPEEGAKGVKPEKKRYNCWGYTESYYFAPKAAFAADKDAVKEFKDMVKELHRNGIEIIMQFYFPNSVNTGLILDVLKYWMLEYHIDGFHLKGERIPLQVIATEPLLTDTKLFHYDFPYGLVYGKDEVPAYRNLGNYNDEYMYSVRSFLKGDDGMLGKFLDLQRRNPAYCGVVNYITNYYGFSLSDMVSYEKKHNEENGEGNRDGNDNNMTWNCGIEGNTRRKNVLELRKQQMKNGISMLFLAQGTPLIYSGDEFGNTRYGNNNPYCQDNETGWVKWNTGAFGREIFSFVKEVIALRKRHPVLHNGSELKILDYIGCGYPDVSYHGEEAWRADFGYSSRFAGVMYCGCYAKKVQDGMEEDDFFYIAYNMHWLRHSFALPQLPRGMKWCLLTDTGKMEGFAEETDFADEQEMPQQARVEPRTIQIYISKKIKTPKEALKRQKTPSKSF